ncbi:MAG: hypothetical protein JWR54_1009 [Mucilaginibacter sp.]|nr:hypothetical protein [Mucilaginibacter sp.]
MILFLYPIKIIASVAAACELLNPNISLRCVFEQLNIFRVKNADIHFPARAAIVRLIATLIAPSPLKAHGD